MKPYVKLLLNLEVVDLFSGKKGFFSIGALLGVFIVTLLCLLVFSVTFSANNTNQIITDVFTESEEAYAQALHQIERSTPCPSEDPY